MAAKKTNNKYKADNILELLFTLLQAGEAGTGVKTLLDVFKCHRRTLVRWRALLESQTANIRFHVDEPGGGAEERWFATLATKVGGEKASKREQLLRIIRAIHKPFGADLANIATTAHWPELKAESEAVLVKFLDHLVGESPMQFTYKKREYNGIPLVMVQSSDGLYAVVLVYPHKALYTFRLDLISGIRRVPLDVIRDTGALPELPALRETIHRKLKTSANMFINWKDVTPTVIEFRFRNLEKKVLENKCRGVELKQVDPSDPTVWDVKMKFSGWMEASKFMKEMLSTYSIRSPKWAVEQFTKEITTALEDLDDLDD